MTIVQTVQIAGLPDRPRALPAKADRQQSRKSESLRERVAYVIFERRVISDVYGGSRFINKTDYEYADRIIKLVKGKDEVR